MEEENRLVEGKNTKSGLARLLLMIFGAVTLVGLGAVGVYGLVRQKPEWFGIKSEVKTEEESKQEVEKLVKEVGKIIELPSGETPTLATVTDLEKLKSQPFFAKAKNGDKVLVYVETKKAYLYRPSEKKLIEVGALTNTNGGQVAGEQTEPLEVQVLPSPSQEVATPTGGSTLTPTRSLPSPTSTLSPTSQVQVTP